jgi:DNA-directed RNA polymerase specialized sigma24 family protein
MAKKTFSSEEFERFLLWLDKDRDEAGRKYEEIRLSLTKIFYARGCKTAEELASETLDRVVTVCQKIIDTYEGNPKIFCHAVAKKVFLEHTRNPKFASLDESPSQNNTAAAAAAKEKEAADIRYKCLQKCLDALSPDERELITKYHSDSSQVEEKKERKRELERIFNISYKALRVRAHRIRKTLYDCMEKCTKNS